MQLNKHGLETLSGFPSLITEFFAVKNDLKNVIRRCIRENKYTETKIIFEKFGIKTEGIKCKDYPGKIHIYFSKHEEYIKNAIEADNKNKKKSGEIFQFPDCCINFHEETQKDEYSFGAIPSPIQTFSNTKNEEKTGTNN